MKIQVRIEQEGTLRPERRAFADRFTPATKVLKSARLARIFHVCSQRPAQRGIAARI